MSELRGSSTPAWGLSEVKLRIPKLPSCHVDYVSAYTQPSIDASAVAQMRAIPKAKPPSVGSEPLLLPAVDVIDASTLVVALASFV